MFICISDISRPPAHLRRSFIAIECERKKNVNIPWWVKSNQLPFAVVVVAGHLANLFSFVMRSGTNDMCYMVTHSAKLRQTPRWLKQTINYLIKIEKYEKSTPKSPEIMSVREKISNFIWFLPRIVARHWKWLDVSIWLICLVTAKNFSRSASIAAVAVMALEQQKWSRNESHPILIKTNVSWQWQQSAHRSWHAFIIWRIYQMNHVKMTWAKCTDWRRQNVYLHFVCNRSAIWSDACQQRRRRRRQP